MSLLVRSALATLGFAGLAAVAACSNDGVDSSQATIQYAGSCTKADCADLERPDTNCTDTAPLFTCGEAANGTCGLTFRCPDSNEPGAAVSISPCDDAECGAKPTNAAEAGCATGREYTGSMCGKLNGSKTCTWQNGCAKLGEPIDIDESKVGAECGIEDDGGIVQCPSGQECVTLPLETGVRGAHCIADPCALLGCEDECITATSYPGQVSCTD